MKPDSGSPARDAQAAAEGQPAEPFARYRRVAAGLTQLGIICLSVASATAVNLLMTRSDQRAAIFGAYYIAIAVCAWAGGWTLGAAAVGLSVTVADFLFLPPFRQIAAHSGQDLTRILLFCAVSSIVIAAFESSRRAGRRSDQSARLAEERANTLTAERAQLVATDQALRHRSEELEKSERRSAQDLEAMERLNAVGTFCTRSGDRQSQSLERILDAAISVTGADKGHIQLADRATGALVLTAQRGFGPDFLRYFARVIGPGTACDAALRAAMQTVVADVQSSPIFAGQPSLAYLQAEKVRAVQSTPSVAANGAVLGVVSTHYCGEFRPAARELRLMDLLALQAGGYLERRQAEAQLKAHVAEIELLNAQLRRAMAETHHRVKNNLQIISALVDIQAMDHQEAVPVAELVRIGHHTRALAAIHDLLTERARADGSSATVQAGDVLQKLAPLLKSIVSEREIRFNIADIEVALRQGTSLAVLINELVSNAVKHGAGDIDVSLAVVQEQARLSVCDCGPGFNAGFDPKTAGSTGLELVESLGRHDLMGTVSYENRSEGGARVVVEFPKGSGE